MEIVDENSSAASRYAASLAAVALGASVPILILGRAGMAVAIAIAIIGLVVTSDRSRLVYDVTAAIKTPLGTAVAVTFALWLVSVIGSPEVALSAKIWARMIALLVAAVALVSLLRRAPHLHDLALKALIVTALAGAAVGLVTVLMWPDPLLSLRGHGANLDQANLAVSVLKSYGTAIACAMPVVLWAGWRMDARWRAPAVIFQFLALALLIVLESRAGLVAAAVGGGIFACWFVWRIGRAWLIGAVALIMAAGIAIAFATNERNNQIEAALDLPIWLVDAHRQTIWDASLQRFTEAPIFGWGIDVIDKLPGANDIVPGSGVEFIPSHPHNWAIEVLAETGVVGFAAMSVALIVLAVGGIRATRRDGAPGATLLAVCAIFFLVSLISYSFWAFWWQATFVLMASLAIAPLTPGLVSSSRSPKVTAT
ncbi:MAG: O-antigen ligase family protein [Pseudomonadota bacterium]